MQELGSRSLHIIFRQVPLVKYEAIQTNGDLKKKILWTTNLLRYNMTLTLKLGGGKYGLDMDFT